MSSSRPPSSIWYGIAGMIALVGIAVAVLWGLAAYNGLRDRIDAFPRASVPGEAVVPVTGPEQLTVFFETPRLAGEEAAPPLVITVTDPSGSVVPTAASTLDLRFDHADRVGVSVATFAPTTEGTYRVAVAGDVLPAASISVGRSIDVGLVANAIGAVALLIASLAASLVIVLVVAIQRVRVVDGEPVVPTPATLAR